MCSVLLQSADPTVLSFVCSGGSRERKTNAGIVHTALRVGLAGGLFDPRRRRTCSNTSGGGRHPDDVPSGEALEGSAKYLRHLGRFVASIRDSCLPPSAVAGGSNGPPSRRRGLDDRILQELLNGDVMDQLLRISKFAPPLEDVESFRAVLAAADDWQSETHDEAQHHLTQAARECRRVIFLLLGDKDRSPFLRHIHDEANAEKEIGGRSSPQEQIVSRALLWLMSNEYSLPTRAFILHCLRLTPQLIFPFFRSLPMPEARPTYECLSAIAFVSNVLMDGPSISDCIARADSSSIRSDQAMHCTLPTSVSKAFLTKAIQNQNSLLVAETLRLISDILKRADKRRSLLVITDALQKRLPDLQILLSLRSRFDPFVLATNKDDLDDESESEDDEDGQATALLAKEEVVTLRLCEVLQLYAQILPSTAIRSVKFDWAKLFPDDVASFFSVSPTVQLSLLQTFDATAIQHSSRVSITSSPKALRALLLIVLSSTSSSVYDLARKLANRLIFTAISADSMDDAESRRCLEYETTLWVDGVSGETLEAFQSLVAASCQHTAQHTLSASRAWSAQFPSKAMPPHLCFSGILSAAIAGVVLDPSGFSSEFSAFVCGVAAKSLLYHRFPQALAAFIKYCGGIAKGGTAGDGNDHAKNGSQRLLLRYASGLVDDQGTQDLGELKDLAAGLFEEENVHSKLYHVETGRVKYPLEPEAMRSILPVVIVRQCLSRLAFIRSHNNPSVGERLYFIIQQTLTYASIDDRDDILRDIFKHPYVLDGCGSTDEAANFVSSLPASGHTSTASSADGDIAHDFAEIWVQKFANALGTDQVSNSMAVLISALSTFVGPSFAARVVAFVLKESQCLASSELLRALLLTALTTVGSAHTFNRAFPVSELVNVWIDLASLNNGTKDKQVEVPLQLALEEVMINILVRSELNGIVAANLAATLLSNIERVFPSYVASFVLSKDYRSSHSSNLLAAMVKYDVVQFAPLLSMLLASDKQPLLKLQLGDQWFTAVSPLLLSYAKQMSCVSALPTCPSLNELAWQGIEAVLAEGSKGIEEGNIELVKDWLPVMLSLLGNSDADGGEDAFESMLVFFKSLASRPRLRLAASAEESMLDSAIGLCANASGGALASNRLRSYLFLRLLALLPKALRKDQRRKSQSAASKDPDPIFVLNSLIRLLNEGSGLEEDIILNDGASVRTGFISSLKHGIQITETDNGSDIASMCLRFARTLVVKASTRYPAIVKQVEMLQPAQVHRMVTSHSNFFATMQHGNNVHDSQTSTRQELIHLLICCASLCSGALENVEDAWKAVLQAYSAGVTKEDKALRRLMHLYGSSVDKKETCFIDTLKWGDILGASDVPIAAQGSTVDGGDYAQQYEWFVQGLDIRRVRSTLSCFPVWERLVPGADPSLEPWVAAIEEDPMDKDDASSTYSGASGDDIGDETDDDMEDDEMNDANRNNHLPPMPRRTEDESDKWNGHGPDDRYSPPFILTLCLATLEAFNIPTAQPSEKENRIGEDNDDMSSEEDPDKPKRETFVKIARRLIEKGCISLSLAALSSKCPSVRRVTIATMGLLLKAVHMEEAHNLKTWRERPQLAMVLDSVQRGVAVRRAITLARRQEEGVENQPLLIPMFPAVSAVFLGWSALIVSRPSDDMFASANRSFLRLDSYHGAFKDCFTLPAFISLFCGSFAEVNSQARRERLWALQLLKDGVRDSYCYKVAARRHAPALIMTSFELLPSCEGLHEADAEPYLILETIESLLLNGGHAARRHLIFNIGICSWLRGILIGKQHTFVFPSAKMFLLFIRLVDNVFKCALREENGEADSASDIRAEAMAMAGPLVDAYEKVCDHTTAEPASREVFRALLPTLDTLSICSGFKMGCEAPLLFDSLREDGIAIVAACKIMGKAEDLNDDLRNKAFRALSTLPLSTSAGDQDVGKLFCLSLLKTARQTSVGTRASLLGNALTRVLYVLGAFEDKLQGDEDLIEAVLSCKMKSQWCGGSTVLTKAVEVLDG